MQPNIVLNHLDFSKENNRSFNNTKINNSWAYMAMIKKMKQEQLIARLIQHGSSLFLSPSDIHQVLDSKKCHLEVFYGL